LETRRIPVDLLVSEAALRYVVGGPRVWRGQLRRLLEIGEIRQVTVRVLPFAAGAAAAMATSCHILEYEGSLPAVVYFETRHGAGFVEQPDEAEIWKRDFQNLWDMSWAPAQSRDAIAATISERG